MSILLDCFVRKFRNAFMPMYGLPSDEYVGMPDRTILWKRMKTNRIVMSSEALDTATSKRAALLLRINGYIAWTADPAMEQLDFYQIKARLDRYGENFLSFEAAHGTVAGATTDDTARNALWAEFADIEDRFIDAQARMTRRFVQLTPTTAPSQRANATNMGTDEAGAVGGVPAQGTGQNIVVQLPFQSQNVQNTWGSFNGNPLDWHDFRARFELAIHNRDEIPAAYKLSYLRNSLKGDAARASAGWILNPENYQKAWDELVAKYDKRYPLACAYLSSFFAMKKLNDQATPADLRRLSDEANALVRQLQALRYPVEHWDLVIVHALQERLNKLYLDKWDTERGDNEEPTVEQMTKFLDRHATRNADRSLAQLSLQSAGSNERNQRSQLQSVVHRPTSSARSSGLLPMHPCAACQAPDHLVFDCPEFKPLSVKERMRIVLDNGMCMNCLKRGHQRANCFDRNRCKLKECEKDNQHNSMLCPHKNQQQHVMAAQYDDRDEDTPRRSSSSRGEDDSSRSGRGRYRGQSNKRPSDNSQS